jgi:hypothetical protein
MVTILLFILLALFGAGEWSPYVASPEVTDCVGQGQETSSATESCRPSTPVAVASPMAACTVEPRTIGGLNEIGTTGTPDPNATGLDDQTPSPYVKPEGIPASQAALDGVTATVGQFAACANEGDFLRFLALFSDDFIRANAEAIGIPLAENDPLVTPMPIEQDEWISVLSVEDVLEYSDGAVHALVVFSTPGDTAETAAFALMLRYDSNRERWLVDEVHEVTLATTGWTIVQGDGYEGAIIPSEDATEFTDLFISEPIQGAWTPTEADIAALEQDMPGYLQTVATSTPWISDDFVDRLPDYKRQYAGFVQGGQNLILVNATCAGDDLQWQKSPVIVMDGGDCFFRVTYDPASGTFSGFQVNGEA